MTAPSTCPERTRSEDLPTTMGLEALVSLAASTCGESARAVINVLTVDEQVQVAAHGFAGSVSPRRDSMCAVVVHETQPVILRDAREDPRFAANPWVVRDGVRFYASYQLRADGAALGSLCVFDDVPLVIDAGQQRRLDAISRDVSAVLTSYMRAEAINAEVLALRREREELLRSNADLVTFGAYLAHDLLNPVTALQTSIEVARDELDGPTPDRQSIDNLLARALRSGRRVQTMVESLPAYARLGAQLHLEPVDLGDLVAEVLEDLPGLEPGQLQANNLPVVQADRLHLRSLVQNLVANSHKFNRGSTVTPLIDVWATSTPGWHHIEVVDHGRGMDENDLHSAVEPAVRGRNADGIAGSGFGLTIAARVVEGHGGVLGLRKTPGGGLTVWFDLPDTPG